MTDVPDDLADLRARIDDVDARLVRLLAERFAVTRQVGVLKARTHLPPADPAREGAQVARVRRLAEESGVDPDLAEDILRHLQAAVVREHRRVSPPPPAQAVD